MWWDAHRHLGPLRAGDGSRSGGCVQDAPSQSQALSWEASICLNRPVPKLKIISGGQTGADRAALDWAMRCGLPLGGWCPLGRMAEDGSIDNKYPLQETPSSEYAERTRWNVRDADGTVIFSIAKELSGGSLATKYFARQLHKPWLHVSQATLEPAAKLRAFVERHQIEVLNVAGPRASVETDIGKFVEAILEQAFGPSLARGGRR